MNRAHHMVAAEGFDFSSRTFTSTAELLGFVPENPSHYSQLGMTSRDRPGRFSRRPVCLSKETGKHSSNQPAHNVSYDDLRSLVIFDNLK